MWALHGLPDSVDHCRRGGRASGSCDVCRRKAVQGGSNGSSIGVWQNAYAPALNYALSTTDMTHLLGGSAVWSLPVGKGKQFVNRGGILDGIIGGWKLSSMWQYHTGLPFTPTIGTSNLSGALSGTWLPNRLASGTLANPTIAKWFNVSAFAVPAPYTFGNSGRDILFGPHYADVDFSLAKSFKMPFHEGASLLIRIDSSDVFNHPNFGQPGAGIGTSGAGIITNALNSRAVQLGAKLSF